MRIERVARFFLYLLSIIIGAVGIMYLLNPVGSMTAAEISILSAAGSTEIRGMYGGLHLALAVFILLSTRSGLYQSGLLLIALVFGCVALGRLVGFSVERAADTYNLVVTIIEIAIFTITLFLLRAGAVYSQRGSSIPKSASIWPN